MEFEAAKEFPKYPKNPAVVSPEWVAYDRSERWAVLADFDVTVFGCYPDFAVEIDKHLVKSETSLLGLTEKDYGTDCEWDYLKAVIQKPE